MPFAYALTFFCDAMLYYGALGCLGLLRACRADLFCVPAMLLAGCWLSGRLAGRGRLRWLPMAVIAPALLLAGNAPGRLLSLPMMVYLPLYVRNNRRAPDYDNAADRFRHSLIAAGAALLLAALVRADSWKLGLPYLFAYFTLNTALLRLLRHDDPVARSRRFRILNLCGVALVCAAGFALSRPEIVAAVRVGWQWFLDNVVLNLIALLLFAFQWVLYAGAWLLSLIPGVDRGDSFEIPSLDRAADRPEMLHAAAAVRALPLFVRYAVMAGGAALLAALVFMILRALSRRVARPEFASVAEQRESLDAEAPPRPRNLRLRRPPEDGVRQQYRRALALTRARGGKVAPNMNTLQILEENAETVDPDAMRQLREIYLPVRYGSRQATRADVARAREALKQLQRAR